MEFDKYGRIKNPHISGPEPITRYTQTQNSRSSSSFLLWDWFNDLVIGIGNFIGRSIDVILSILIWIAIIAGVVYGISTISDMWSKHGFVVAALVTFFAGYFCFAIYFLVVSVLLWIVSALLSIIRFVFYNAYTLLLTIAIICGIKWLL